MVWDGLLDEAVVYLGLMGEVRVDRRAVGIVEMGVGIAEAFLRKTRAGGNWLTGGMVKVKVCVCGVGGWRWTGSCVRQDGLRQALVGSVLALKLMVMDGYKLSWMFCRSQRGAASQCLSIPQSDSPRSVDWTHSPSLRGASREQSQAGSARPTAMAPF